MLSSFWEQISGSATESFINQWFSRLFGTVLIFWGGSLLTWAWFDRQTFNYLMGYLGKIDKLPIGYLVFLGLLFIFSLALSHIVMDWMTFPLLRLLEGYWPYPLKEYAFQYQSKIKGKKEERWAELARCYQEIETSSQDESNREIENSSIEPQESTTNQFGGLTRKEMEEYNRLDSDLAKYPLKAEHIMPTQVGNILKSAEEHPYVRYGLETITVWPHLWLTLPSSVQEELIAIRSQLNNTTQMFGWSFAYTLYWGLIFPLYWYHKFFFIPSYWGWIVGFWPLVIGIILMRVSYLRIVQATEIYGELLKATFDLYRFNLYKEFHWPLPANLEQEQEQGENLTLYIFRGFSNTPISFEHN